MRRNLSNRVMPRQGFTLVEMLVATALIIFVMLILTTVFTAGLTAMRNMRGVGSLQDNLRQAATIMRRDLATHHFDSEVTSTAGPMLSQQRLDRYDWKPPKEGFFRIWQSAPSRSEGNDGDLDSFKMDPTKPGQFSYLHFTVHNEVGSGEGGGRDRFFASANLNSMIPGMAWASRPDYLSLSGTFYSPWAEVAYFLQPTGEVVGASGMPVHTLFRRRRLIVDMRPPNELPPSTAAVLDQLTEVSFHHIDASNVVPNIPADVTVPTNRFGMNLTPPAGIGTNMHTFPALAASTDPAMAKANGGDDVLMENVISFDIRASWDVPNDVRIAMSLSPLPVPLAPTAFAPNTDYPFDDLPYPSTSVSSWNGDIAAQRVRVFDTWSSRAPTYSAWNQPNQPGTLPLRIRIKALQIRLRVWDSRTQQTRQITIIQDM